MRALTFTLLLFIAALVSISCTSNGSEAVPSAPSPTAKVVYYSDLAASRELPTTMQSADSTDGESASGFDVITDINSEAKETLPGPIDTRFSTTQSPPIVASPTAPSVTMTLELTKVPQIVTQVPEMPTPGIPTTVNGVPIDSIVIMPESVIEHSREIFTLGQSRGRSPHSFSKLGDSLIANPHFLTGFDTRPYNLGSYDQLQPTVEYFEGSFERFGVAIHAGLHSWGIFDPMWANKEWCQPNESIVACEFRLNNPSVLLILIGSNDAGAAASFEYNIRKLVEYSIENGVIPVLTTKADRFEGLENINNIMIREIARDFDILLWDFDIVADAIEGRGLKEDQVHLTPFDEFDYTLLQAFATGHGVHNLTALMVLDAIRTQIMESP